MRRRVVAALIDLFLIGVLCVLWRVLVNPDEEVPGPVLFWVGIFVIPFPYWLLGDFAGVSPGKALVGLRVLDAETGEAPRGNTAVVRAAVALLGALRFIFIWRDPSQRALHDRAAGTLVVARRSCYSDSPAASRASSGLR